MPNVDSILPNPEKDTMTTPSPLIAFPCPACGKELKAPEYTGGRASKCVACGAEVVVPKRHWQAQHLIVPALVAVWIAGIGLGFASIKSTGKGVAGPTPAAMPLPATVFEVAQDVPPPGKIEIATAATVKEEPATEPLPKNVEPKWTVVSEAQFRTSVIGKTMENVLGFVGDDYELSHVEKRNMGGGYQGYLAGVLNPPTRIDVIYLGRTGANTVQIIHFTNRIALSVTFVPSAAFSQNKELSKELQAGLKNPQALADWNEKAMKKVKKLVEDGNRLAAKNAIEPHKEESKLLIGNKIEWELKVIAVGDKGNVFANGEWRGLDSLTSSLQIAGGWPTGKDDDQTWLASLKSGSKIILRGTISDVKFESEIGNDPRPLDPSAILVTLKDFKLSAK